MVGELEVGCDISGSSLIGGVEERTGAESLLQHILRRVLLNLPIFSVVVVVVVGGIVLDRVV